MPIKPPLADENTKEGLEAFTRYWFELFDYGYATNDWTAFDAVTDPGCLSCNNVRGVVDDIYSDNRWIAGGDFEVINYVSDFEVNTAGSVQAFVHNKQSAITYFESDGSELRRDPAPTPTTDVVFASHENDQWVLVDYGKPEGSS
ncbi:hypothetical protein IWX65_000464 [Arthrobacter sp. CAN_A214]